MIAVDESIFADDDLGTIFMFGGPVAPPGTARCDGQLLRVLDNGALFRKIGTAFGGDGFEFALPDLRGRMPRCAGRSLSGDLAVGDQFGAEFTTISLAQLPAHTHTLPDGEVTSVVGVDRPERFNVQSPQLVVACQMRVQGNLPVSNRKRDLAGFIGEIRYSASSIAPSAYLPLDGQILDISQNQDLFSVLGCVCLRSFLAL